MIDLGKTATGFAVVRDGVLDVRTVTDDKRGAMLNGMMAAGYMVQPCTKPECDCVDRAFAKFLPDAKLVEVMVSAQS